LGSALAADEVDAAALQQQQKQNAKSGAAFMPPWVPGMPRFVSPSLRLHQEVVAFTQILEPTPQEADARRTAVDAVRGLVQGIWKDADVKPFGSYATGGLIQAAAAGGGTC
jgi:DNA polymerase sigma